MKDDVQAFQFGMSCGAEVVLHTLEKWKDQPGCWVHPDIVELVRKQAMALYRSAQGIPEETVEQVAAGPSNNGETVNDAGQETRRRSYNLSAEGRARKAEAAREYWRKRKEQQGGSHADY